jgi:hypothetical protein
MTVLWYIAWVSPLILSWQGKVHPGGDCCAVPVFGRRLLEGTTLKALLVLGR